MAGCEAETALGIPAKLAELRRLLEIIKAAGRGAQKPIDRASIKSRGGANFSGGVAISHSSGESLTLTKTTTEPSLRFEGDSKQNPAKHRSF